MVKIINNGKFKRSLKETKNARGNVIFKTMQLIPEESKKANETNMISNDNVNKIYKQMLEKNDAKHILIRAMCIDGIKTLKSFDHEGEDIKYCMEDYYNSMPLEFQSKFSDYLYVEFIVRY